jgi:hypothetical protein
MLGLNRVPSEYGCYKQFSVFHKCDIKNVKMTCKQALSLQLHGRTTVLDFKYMPTDNKLMQKFILSFHSAVRMQLNTTEQDGLEAVL